MTPQRKRPAKRLFKGLVGDRESEHVPNTKSLRHMEVVSADPDAPYGRDEDNKPIVPMRTDQQIAEELIKKPFLAPGLCPHKNDLDNCTLCGTKDFSIGGGLTPSFKPDTPEQAAARLEQNVRNMFGLPTPPSVRHDFSAVAPSKVKFDSYRDLLMLERQTIADIFDCIVKYQRPAKPSEDHIKQLEREIAELDDLIPTRSAAWQKRHRPDDPLEKNDRERLKYQETKLRDKKKTEMRSLKAQLRRWEQVPPIPITFEEKYHVTHRHVSSVERGVFDPDKLRTPAGQDPYYTEVLTTIETYEGGEYNIEGYRKLLQLDVGALTQFDDGLTWRGWQEWENKVILQAIVCGLLKPEVEVVKNYPGLGVYRPPADDPIEADETENLLIVKTGGASVNGRMRIHGAGYKGAANNRQRKLSEFNRPVKIKYGGADEGEADSDSIIDGDEGSYSPD